MHNLHELVNLLWRKNGSGFVKNHDFIVPVKHFQDFHPLLHPHRDILDQGVRVNVQAVPLTESHYLFPCIIHFQKSMPDRLHAQDDILQDRKIMHQLKMLVYHADAQGIGIQGAFDFHFLSPDLNHTLFWLVKPEQHAHQRGLTRSVLTQQGVDFPLLKLKGDIVIRYNTGKFLCDAQHLNNIIVHAVPPRNKPACAALPSPPGGMKA